MQHTDDVPANSYKTGHVPKESFAAFVARCNANSHFPEDLSTQHPPPKMSKRARKLVEFAETLSDVECLLDLVRRVRAPLLIHGNLYGAMRTRFGWSLRPLEGVERQLNVDATSCSCEDNKFRHRSCKHMEALKCFCHPA